MVLIDPEYVAEAKKVYANLLAAFRYGREDLDVLGLQFRKDLFTSNMQVYPPDPSYKDKPLTRLQERLKKKLGEHAYPFWFEVLLFFSWKNNLKFTIFVKISHIISIILFNFNTICKLEIAYNKT